MMDAFSDMGSFGTMVRRSLADPGRAVLVIVLGVFAIYRELMRPGRVLPGVVGAVAVALGTQALLRHDIAPIGGGLLVLALLLAGAQVVARLAWIPALGAAAAALAGSRWLVEGRTLGWTASVAVAVLAGATAVLLRHAWHGFRRKRTI